MATIRPKKPPSLCGSDAKLRGRAEGDCAEGRAVTFAGRKTAETCASQSRFGGDPLSRALRGKREDRKLSRFHPDRVCAPILAQEKEARPMTAVLPHKRRRRGYVGLAYIAPWLIGLLIFQAYPFLYSLVLSFTDKTLSDHTNFVGLENYIRLFTRDRDFYKVCEVTLKYVLFAVPGRVLFALLIALLMNTNHRGIHLFRTLYYLPSIFGGSVAIAVVWKLMFQNSGVVNALLGTLGIDPIKWLGHPKVALTTITIIPIWQFGSSMVLFLAALKNVPQELYEASRMDGCRPLGMFWRITLPMISPILLFNLMCR
jgi:oligogalacturonide transport system permease protein